MALGCGMALCKYILFFSNFLIFLCGMAILAIGIWLAVDKTSVMGLLKVSQQASDNADVANINQATVLEQLAYILIAIGAIVLILGFFGCCGAAQESKGLLTAYVALLLTMILLEVAGGIYAGVSKDTFKKHLKEIAKSSLIRFRNESNQDAFTLSWRYVFAEFECCGIDGAADLVGSEWEKERPKDQFIPVACCKLIDKKRFIPIDPKCPYIDPKVERRYENSNAHKGCYYPVADWFDDHWQIILGGAIIVGLIQFFGMSIGCCICCAIRQITKAY